MAGKKHKQASILKQVETSKVPRTITDPEQYMNQSPAWRIAMLEMQEPFGWHQVGEPILNRIRDRLKSFESMTWHQIFGNENHFIPVADICKDAQKRLAHLKQDDIDQVVSLRITGKQRVYGIWEAGVLRLLWWDPDHKICPSPKKHT